MFVGKIRVAYPSNTDRRQTTGSHFDAHSSIELNNKSFPISNVLPPSDHPTCVQHYSLITMLFPSPLPSLEEIVAVGSSLVVAAAVEAATAEMDAQRLPRARGRYFQRRERRSMTDVYNLMGDLIFRRAFRMTFDSFWRLHAILLPHITLMTLKTKPYEIKGGRGGGSYSLPPIRNGPITTSIRLGAALRYFAGGAPYDIMCCFCIAYSEVLVSVWIVVDAINACPQFCIMYPESLEEQQRIAAGFETASTPGIQNCAGAIDGILIWILKPSLMEAKKVGVDQKKFLCGRKHKYGLNCQAVSDCHGKIIDISMKCGGASADCLAFEASELHKRLENGLMHEGYVLFGDNAYLNTPYMATPFTNVSGDPNRVAEDSYNFYHSQLRIRVECAFGMLVQRWGILRMAMPRKLTIAKIVAMVNALAKLHNFCIDEADTVVPPIHDRDHFFMMNNSHGYVGGNNNNTSDEVTTPPDLAHGGEHFDEIHRSTLRAQREKFRSTILPRTELFNMITEGHWERPTRMGSSTRRK